MASEPLALTPHPPSPVEPGEGGTPDRRWTSRRFVLGALLGIQILLAAIALAVWVWTPEAPPLPPESETSAPLDGSGATYESALPLAQAQADDWLPGAVLINASMQVDWPWSVSLDPPPALPGTGWLTYVFVAPWNAPGRPEGAASLGVTIERLDGSVVSEETLGWEDAPVDRAPPPPAAVDASAATLLAEEAGGTDFRRGCPQYRHVSRTFPLAAGRTAWPQHWVVIYDDTRVPDKHGLLLRIDAETGETLDRSGDAPECEQEP
ncbi:MAG: hypothetical protein M3Q50_15170 [Chloroflexota bacterium]|nr:hypothetical protein [Chloroflexota bacterium]